MIIFKIKLNKKKGTSIQKRNKINVNQLKTKKKIKLFFIYSLDCGSRIAFT